MKNIGRFIHDQIIKALLKLRLGDLNILVGGPLPINYTVVYLCYIILVLLFILG